MSRLVRALAACVALAAVLPAAADANAMIATGTLKDADGNAASGTVRVYAWVFPKKGQTAELPLLGSTTAGADGRFEISTLDANLLQRLAGPRAGWVDFTVVGDTGSYSGSWGYTGYVDAPGGVARVSSADEIIQSRATGAKAASVPTTAPDVTIHATRRTLFAQAAQVGRCDTKMTVKPLESIPKMTVVGELNNAYNDGTTGTFTYGRGRSAETVIGAASQFQDGSWGISAEYLISDSGEAGFVPAPRRWSRRLRTSFEYTKYFVKASSCAKPETVIRATGWLGGANDTIKQNGLDKCDTKYGGQFPSGTRFKRQSGEAVRYTRAVEAFGVSLTARSGYTQNVTAEFAWRGPRGKMHYVCGADGKESAYTSGRIFTGSKK
jgi:hypothetical protein